jgi:hypothetical protein
MRLGRVGTQITQVVALMPHPLQSWNDDRDTMDGFISFESNRTVCVHVVQKHIERTQYSSKKKKKNEHSIVLASSCDAATICQNFI